MGINPYIHSLTIKNYRSLHNCKLPLRLINIIGGMNGVGKTSLLEAVFTLLDRRDPVVLARPAMFRNFPFDFEPESRRLFWNGNTADTIEITIDSRQGIETLSIAHGTVTLPERPTRIPIPPAQQFLRSYSPQRSG